MYNRSGYHATRCTVHDAPWTLLNKHGGGGMLKSSGRQPNYVMCITSMAKASRGVTMLLSGEVGGGRRSRHGVVAPWRSDQCVLSGALDHPHTATHSPGWVAETARRSLSLAHCRRRRDGCSLTPARRIRTARRAGDMTHNCCPHSVGTVRSEPWLTDKSEACSATFSSMLGCFLGKPFFKEDHHGKHALPV